MYVSSKCVLSPPSLVRFLCRYLLTSEPGVSAPGEELRVGHSLRNEAVLDVRPDGLQPPRWVEGQVALRLHEIVAACFDGQVQHFFVGLRVFVHLGILEELMVGADGEADLDIRVHREGDRLLLRVVEDKGRCLWYGYAP